MLLYHYMLMQVDVGWWEACKSKPKNRASILPINKLTFFYSPFSPPSIWNGCYKAEESNCFQLSNLPSPLCGALSSAPEASTLLSYLPVSTLALPSGGCANPHPPDSFCNHTHALSLSHGSTPQPTVQQTVPWAACWQLRRQTSCSSTKCSNNEAIASSGWRSKISQHKY